MEKLFIILCIILVIGCKASTDKITNEDPAISSTTTKTGNVKPAEGTIADIEGCYMQVLKRDTFAASLQQQGNSITGKLSFDNYEKDGSNGTVTGKLDGDLLRLVYSFASEGMNSVMELYFKYKDGELVRGIGEMNTKGDTAYFINPGSIKYDGGVLKKISCDKLPHKYK